MIESNTAATALIAAIRSAGECLDDKPVILSSAGKDDNARSTMVPAAKVAAAKNLIRSKNGISSKVAVSGRFRCHAAYFSGLFNIFANWKNKMSIPKETHGLEERKKERFPRLHSVYSNGNSGSKYGVVRGKSRFKFQWIIPADMSRSIILLKL